jgi:hypothetical protein
LFSILLVPPGQDEMTIQVTKDGASVPDCGSTLPCIALRERLADGDVRLTIHTVTASDWEFAVDTLCGSAPRAACREPVAARKSRLLVKHGVTADKSKLGWKWTKGAATSLADFGDPIADTAYALCVYDARRGTPTLIARVAADPGAGWTRKGTKGFQKKGTLGAVDGLQKLTLIAGADGAPKVALSAKGTGTPANALPVIVPLTAQLRSSGGMCWGATYSTLLKNDGTQVSAKND